MGPMLAEFERVFFHRDTHTAPYQFVCAGVALSGDPEVTLTNGRWHLTQRDEQAGLTWHASSESKVGAILALIGHRYGLKVTAETDDDGS